MEAPIVLYCLYVNSFHCTPTIIIKYIKKLSYSIKLVLMLLFAIEYYSVSHKYYGIQSITVKLAYYRILSVYILSYTVCIYTVCINTIVYCLSIIVHSKLLSNTIKLHRILCTYQKMLATYYRIASHTIVQHHISFSNQDSQSFMQPLLLMATIPLPLSFYTTSTTSSSSLPQ